MFTVFGCSRIVYDKVDVSDPASAQLCQQLQSLAQNSRQYPQFFLARPDGTVSFWGGWDRFFATAEDTRKLVVALEDPERACDGRR